MLSCLVAFICLGKGGFDLALDSALAEGVIGGVVAGCVRSEGVVAQLLLRAWRRMVHKTFGARRSLNYVGTPAAQNGSSIPDGSAPTTPRYSSVSRNCDELA